MTNDVLIAKGVLEYVTAAGYQNIPKKGGDVWNLIQWCDKHNIQIWVEIKSGKYKGSIGRYQSAWSINLGETRMPPLIPKNLKFLPDYAGSYVMSVTKAKPQIDKYGSEIKTGDRVLYGGLVFGVISGFDRHVNRFKIINSDGNTKTGIARNDIVSLEKLDIGKWANIVTMAKLAK